MRHCFYLFFLVIGHSLSAQTVDSIPQKDFSDILKSLRKHNKDKEASKDTLPPKTIEWSIAPAIGYSLSTGIAGVVAMSAAFYLGDRSSTNMSFISCSPTYTQFNQFHIPMAASVWTKNNDFNITADWRFLLFPQDTYGLGGKTTDADQTNMYFTYLRLYQSVMKNLGHNWYVGLGYDLDYYFKTTIDALPDNRVPDALTYGMTSKVVCSGAAATVLYDSRKNPINPKGGEQYANIVYRNNQTAFGSDNNWQSLMIDLRKYIALGDKRHILAFWNYEYLTLSGTPPYQILPSTGWDTYGNTGRGYIQSRFRGTNLLYLESEYRFPLTRNGLLGGVVFANAESFTEPISHQFEKVLPGYGLGVRIKVNKHSDTNVAIDYAWGINHSQGFFVNLSEVF